MSTRKGPGFFGGLKISLKKWLGMRVLLCDSCKWNWRSACKRPERPHATWCLEYEKRG